MVLKYFLILFCTASALWIGSTIIEVFVDCHKSRTMDECLVYILD